LSEKEAIENWTREYATSIVEKLCSDPHGIYYLTELKGAIIGMGVLHQIREKTGEIKRMYIRPAYRGKGYGKTLLQQLLQKAKEFGYHSVYLDTGPFMTAAHRVYRSLGFVDRNEYPESEAQILPTQLISMALHGENPRRNNQMNHKPKPKLRQTEPRLYQLLTDHVLMLLPLFP
jgi:GNAT superfamily N-acetyltransferase